MGLGQLNSQEEHFSCESPPICVLLTWGCEPCLDHISTSPTHCFVALSLHLYLYKIFSVSLQIILTDSCFVSSCNFGVPMCGGEFKVFLLYCLDPTHGFLNILLKESR